jgi:hypothetical protein
MQRDFIRNFHDRSNHLVFPGEILSFQVLFQVTEQKAVARCDVAGIRWLRYQDEAQLFNLFNGYFGCVWFGVVNMKVSCCCLQFQTTLPRFFSVLCRTVSAKNCELYFCPMGRNSMETKPQREKWAEIIIFLTRSSASHFVAAHPCLVPTFRDVDCPSKSRRWGIHLGAKKWSPRSSETRRIVVRGE